MRRQTPRSLLVTTVCLLILAGCAPSPQPAPPAPTSPPPSPTPAPTLDPRMELALAFRDALNAGDGQAAAALFVDDKPGFLDATYVMTDKAAIAGHIEEGAPGKWTLELAECGPQGELWHCKAAEREYCMKPVIGVDVWRSDMTLTAKDGKIQYIALKASPEDTAAARKAMDTFWTWVQTERAADWKTLSAPESALNGRALGELHLKLCKEYVETHQ